MTVSALLVIDVQQDVMAPSPVAERVIATINGLIGSARAADVPVIFVRHHDEGLLVDSAGWQLDPRLDRRDSEPIVDKTYRDAFLATNLDDVLRDSGARRLVITGAQSDFCVQGTANSAPAHGYDVTLVSDGHTTEPYELAGVAVPAQAVSELVNAQFRWLRYPGRRIEVVSAAEVVF